MELPEGLFDYLNERQPGAVVAKALGRLLKEDSYLLSVDANERSICHRLAMYLQEEFRDYSVDCEYNRTGLDPKRLPHLPLYPDSEDSQARTVYPDIIVHKRGTNGSNYLVIETKKTSSDVGTETDYAKLRAYKASLNYRYALFLEFKVAGHASISKAQWF